MNNNPSNLNSFLHLDFEDETQLWLSKTASLRKFIGILGMALPFLLYGILYLHTGVEKPLESISHYYFTRVSGVFVSILSILGIFLIIYKGKEPVDFFVSLLAGVGILLVVFFPTSNLTTECCDINIKHSVTHIETSSFRELLHYISAGVFLLCLAFMSIFLFTKSNKAPNNRTAQKIFRDRIYRVCGVIMCLAILIILAGFLGWIDRAFYEDNKLTFWMETVAVESFGFSWLIKGETLFQDKKVDSK